jgi:hypothetical protein
VESLLQQPRQINLFAPGYGADRSNLRRCRVMDRTVGAIRTQPVVTDTTRDAVPAGRPRAIAARLHRVEFLIDRDLQETVELPDSFPQPVIRVMYTTAVRLSYASEDAATRGRPIESK